MFRTALLAATALLASCSEENTNPATDRDADAAASYSVTFASEWNQSDFPTNFPGSAHFSGLIGATHSDQVKFWEHGQLASNGIESMAETGSKSALQSEIEAAKKEGTAEFLLSGGGISSSPGSVSLEFDINEANPQVTLVSMLAPSPDWFVGVRDLSLYDGIAGDWKASVSVDLVIYDAGTDDGPVFKSSNADSQPPGIVEPLTSDVGDTDFVDGIHRNSGMHVGTMVFTRVK